MLTQRDLDEIEKLIDEKIKHLPNKDEFYKAMDQIMGELKTMRETYELSVPKISEHEDRIIDLENLHPHGKHASLSSLRENPSL